MNETEFNEVIIKGSKKACPPFESEEDLELDNWLATTFGRHFAGTEVEIEELPHVCPHCDVPDHYHDSTTVAKRRLNTAYVNDESNWFVSCKACYDDLYAMYEEQWKDYYSGAL